MNLIEFSTMAIELLMALHLAGGLLWLGGAVAALWIILERRQADIVAERAFPGLERRFLYWAALPGFAAAAGAGFILTGYNQAYFYVQGWFVVKSAALLLAALATAYLFHTIARDRWKSASEFSLKLAAALLALCGGAILILSCVRPF